MLERAYESFSDAWNWEAERIGHNDNNDGPTETQSTNMEC